MIYVEDRRKLQEGIDMGRLRTCMSKLNVRGWAVSPPGRTYVAFHEGQACLEELDYEDLDRRWRRGESVFFVPVSTARSLKKFLGELTRTAGDGPVDRAAKDRDVKGHYGRLLDQVNLAKARSGPSQRDARQEAVRKEIRALLSKCRNKYGLGRHQLIDIFEDEVKLMFVKDVMES